MGEDRDCWGYAEAAYRLSIGLTTIKRMVRSGAIRAVLIGGRPKIPSSELTRLTMLPVMPVTRVQEHSPGRRKRARTKEDRPKALTAEEAAEAVRNLPF